MNGTTIWVKWAMRLTPPKMMKPRAATTNTAVTVLVTPSSPIGVERRPADTEGHLGRAADAVGLDAGQQQAGSRRW